MDDSCAKICGETSLACEMKPGCRFQLTRLGAERCPKLRGRTGTILGMARSTRAYRVLFDGMKFPQSLHRSYITPIDQMNRISSRHPAQ
jgi:hypothetical protein